MEHYVPWRTALLTVMLVVLIAFVLPRIAAAQRPGHVPRIAVLDLNFPPAADEPTPLRDAFRQGLRDHGWVEGHTIAIEWRWAEASLDRFASLVDEVLRLPVEVLVVPNRATAVIARKATTTIPIVVVSAGTLEGLVASLARPGGNVTGLTTMTPELALTHLELLKEGLPGVTRVAVLQGLASYSASPLWSKTEATARSLGMELRLFEVREPTAFDKVFAAIADAQANALMVFGDPFFAPHFARIAALAVQHRLPSIGPEREAAEAGYLMSYGTNRKAVRQHIAVYVDKILKGATPAELPVEQPTKFELVMNLKTAQALGLTLSPQFLFRADEVIR